MTEEAAVDQTKMEAFLHKVLGDTSSTTVTLMAYLGDRLGNRRSAKWYMLTPMIACLLAIPLSLFSLTHDNLQLVLYVFFPGVLFNAIYLAPCIAISHNLVPANMRAFSSAILFFVLNIIGLGGGPLFVGMLSDSFTADYGDQALRYAMVVAVGAGLIAAALFYKASQTLEKDLEEV